MSTLSYEDFVSDILDLQEGLMSGAQQADARVQYAAGMRKARRKVDPKVASDRAVAAQFSGKALAGSAKQKSWGEKIRADKLRGMSEAQAVNACDPKGLGRSAHFWIANRNRSSAEIGTFFDTQKRILTDALALREAGKTDEFKAAAAAYNALTTDWGFTQ